MLCPLCKETLQIVFRHEVEIDYCPKCRGVWLDRGELQKLIDISMAEARTTVQPIQPIQPVSIDQQKPPLNPDRRVPDPRAAEYREPEYYGEHHRRPADYRYADRHYEYGKPKKRESWLSELFDFD